MADEQDFTDPVYVTGAVYAQLEDLDNATALRVLDEVRAEYQRRIVGATPAKQIECPRCRGAGDVDDGSGTRDVCTCLTCDGRGKLVENEALPGMLRCVTTPGVPFRCECCANRFDVAYQIAGDPNSSHFCFSCVLCSAQDPAFGGDVAAYAEWCLEGSPQDDNGNPVW